MQATDIYQTPLNGRYASKEMQHIFSEDVKFSTWRKLWIALAESEMELGKTEITKEQIDKMKEHIYDINYEIAKEREKEVRHDVMSHVYAYGVQCPNSKGIIHWGATSCYVTDNTDILNIKLALELIKKRLVGVIKLLSDFSYNNRNVPMLGYTHYQPASPVTVGKRASLWLQNFVENYYELEFVINNLKMLGCRGATGTSSTFMEIFEGDEEKVKQLDKLIASKMGFPEDAVYSVSGQTYPRNLDYRVLNCLAEIAVSSVKMGNDIRLLQHDKEIEEPFEKSQIGSSAMAYKRNPMRSERICSLGRYIINQASNTADTASVQWFERTLDDSANRRMCIPESFLATDGLLILVSNVVDGLVINHKVIEKRLNEELPFMATENIIMAAVKKGGDRQELHEHIRVHSMEAGKRIKQEGLNNDLLERIATDSIFKMTLEEVKEECNPSKLIGRCASQVKDYIDGEVSNILSENKELLKDINTEINV